MPTLIIRIGDDTTTAELDDHLLVLQVGAVSLSAAVLTSDPPRPEELTNAIGNVVDHLDDLLLTVPGVIDAAEVRLVGPLPAVIAAVEAGCEPSLPFRLARDAAEDVFRTVATETAIERAHNPGLPATAVDTVVAAACIVVAVMRHFHLAEVIIGGGS